MVMVRAFQIGVLVGLVFCLAGCTATPKEPLWERVKIGDLAPSNTGKKTSNLWLRTTNINMHIFEIPADNISKLDELWPMLYRQPLQLNDKAAFGANGFSAGFGQLPMWEKIATVLRGADGNQAGMIALMLSDNQPQDVFVAGLPREQTIFYVTGQGLTEGAMVGPGRLSLRIKADRIPGARGVCNVSAVPVFSPPVQSAIPLLKRHAKLREFFFGSAGFSLKMGPGDFVVFGLDKYVSQQISLGNLMFSKPQGSIFFSSTERKAPERKPAIRIFLLFCTRTSY